MLFTRKGTVLNSRQTTGLSGPTNNIFGKSHPRPVISTPEPVQTGRVFRVSTIKRRVSVAFVTQYALGKTSGGCRGWLNRLFKS